MKKILLSACALAILAACSTSGKQTQTLASQMPTEADNYYCQAVSAKNLGDKVKEEEIYAQACASGKSAACSLQGIMMIERSDTAGAKTMFKQACDAKNNAGCYNLAILLEGEGDEKGAKKLYKKTCKAGIKEACEILTALK
ncbi:TPR repeat protein [Elusimicrobium posterum]|uniref:hypothetical protein n=1 Tax=Elusimicrobium posterum TaxID=3116653 RepID=UPI003C7886F1